MRLLLLFLPLLLLPHSQQDEHELIKRDNDWQMPDDYYKNWKCISNMPGRQTSNYRDLVKGECADLKDSLNQCCVDFNACSGVRCVENHEECNTNVISGRETQCFAIADRLVQKELRHFPDKDWKCRPPINRMGGRAQNYRDLISSIYCNHFKDSLNECCVNFNNCNGVKCIADHKKCNAIAIRGSEQQCSAIADNLVHEEKEQILPQDYIDNWACTSTLLGGRYYNYKTLVEGSCANLKDSLNKCCVNFKTCRENKDLFCVENHKDCNHHVVAGRESECSEIADKLVRKDLRDTPDKDWKCIPPFGRLGGDDQDYRDLMRNSHCSHLKDKLNQCCVDFNNCKSMLCVEDHEQCNAKVVKGQEQECLPIANRFIAHEKRHFPDKDFKCTGNGIPGARDGIYHKIMKSIVCARLKGKISDCCENFNTCKVSNEPDCIIRHKTCNKQVVHGLEKECSAIVDSLVEKEETTPEDDIHNWKCRPPFGRFGGFEPYYRALTSNIHCSPLKDRLNQCCMDFNKCNGVNCVENHEECNAKVVSGSEKECFAIADKFVSKEQRYFPDKDWECEGPFGRLGGRDDDWRNLRRNIHCFNLKDGLNQCCKNFNNCTGVNCVENHEQCNAVVIRGNEKQCSAIANKFISQEKRHRPEKGWKCTGNGIPGARDGIYHKIMNSLHCAPLKDKISQCCANFNTCSDKKGTDCIIRHKICNEQVVHGSEKECSALVDSLVMKEDTKKEDEKSTNVLIIYYNRVILYSKDQLATHPIRTWVVFGLIAVLSVLFLLSIGCFCCTVLSKKNDETMIYHQSSSRVASSVRSNSGRN